MRVFCPTILPLACLLALLSACSSPERPAFLLKEDGDAAMRAGDPSQAVEDYEAALVRQPGFWQARMALAEALLEVGRPAYAREQMEIVHTIRPNDDDVTELLARTMLESGDTEGMTTFLRSGVASRDRVEDWLRLGRYLALAGDADEAEVALRTAAVRDGGRSAEVQAALGRFYAGIGDDERALRRYRMALYLAPEDPEIAQAIRELGEVPGPTFALPPAELVGS